MQTPSPTQPKTVINYGQDFQEYKRVWFDEKSVCAGRHWQAKVVIAWPYSGQLYCDECLQALTENPLFCQCCHALLGAGSGQEFSTCVRIKTPIYSTDYLCRFCWDGRIKPEESVACTSLAKNWVQFFLKEASTSIGCQTTFNWTLPEHISFEQWTFSEFEATGYGKDALGAQARKTPKSLANDPDPYLYCVYVLRNLRKLQFTATVVHELVHCWQEASGLRGKQKAETDEGFAEWVSYKFLLWYWNITDDLEERKEIEDLAEWKRTVTSIQCTGLKEILGFEKTLVGGDAESNFGNMVTTVDKEETEEYGYEDEDAYEEEEEEKEGEDKVKEGKEEA